jgi:SAM-dependent methyltransferase
MMPDSAPNKWISGDEYVRQITQLEEDRLARLAFQNLVLDIAPRGGRLFDFGAGPGLDARFFAERGLGVEAYDVNPKACEYFATYCRDYIDSGRIILHRGSYREFLDRQTTTAGRTDMIISNFAPLSLVGDLRELFGKFYTLTAPNGKVLASVLNPYFVGDMKFPWWWRRVPRLWRDGHYSLPSPEGVVARRRLAEFAALSSPYFTLTRVYRGLPQSGSHAPRGVDATRTGPRTWFSLATSRFTFLLFDKREYE